MLGTAGVGGAQGAEAAVAPGLADDPGGGVEAVRDIVSRHVPQMPWEL